MRIHLNIKFTFASVADNSYFGIQVVRATDIGTADPEPVAQPDDDWMFVTRVFPGTSGAAVNAQEWHSYDIKSKRKVSEKNQTLALALHNVNAAAQTYSIYARTLLALP
jgi:hypothetical protein